MSTSSRLSSANPVLLRRRRFALMPSPETLEDRALLNATVTVSRVTDIPRFATPSEVGPTPALFRVTRTGDVSGSLTVPVSFSGTATKAVDYLAWENSAVFEAGSSTAYITALPVNNASQDPSQTVTVTLQPGAGYRLGSTASATATIKDFNVAGSRGVWNTPESPTSSNWITYLDAWIANGNLNVFLYFHSPLARTEVGVPINNADTYVNIGINSDQNIKTGDPRPGTVAGTDYVIWGQPDIYGGHFELDKLPTTPGGQSRVIIPNNPWDLVANGYAAIVSIPTKYIGNPSAVDVYAYLLHESLNAESSGGDRAPNYGWFDTSTRKVVVVILV